MKVFVLAAGYATRLHPETRERAKPLLDIGGTPLLTRLLARVLALDGIDEVIVIANARFSAQFELWRESFSCAAALRVLNDGSTSEADRLGALGDLSFALGRVPLHDSDFLVVAGDNLIEFDLLPAHEAFRATGDPLLLVRRVARDGAASAYNEVSLAPDGTVRRFREKPPDPRSDLAAICLYFFPASVADDLERYLAEGGNRDAPGHFLAWLVGTRTVRARPLDGPWLDVGSPETLARAREHFSA